MKTYLLAIVLVLFAVLPSQELFAGTITGYVTGAKSQQPLIGANVLIQDTDLGAATDLDGYFIIRNIPEGKYTVVATFIGYEQRRINNVEVHSNLKTNLDISLESASLEMESVVVEGTAKKTSDSGILLEQRNSSNVQDGVSSAQMSKSGDSDAADALKRVTGVSVVDGNSVYVRGLGERYTNTQMNGVPVPSPDPEKKTVPLNLFSTSLLESITAAKTFTPDLPGVFAGGSVNIRTKAYPDNRSFNISLGSTYNMYGVSNVNFLTTHGGSTDFFGYDDGTRTLPSDVPENIRLYEHNTELGTQLKDRRAYLGNIGRGFESDFTVQQQQPGRPVSFGVNYGDRFNPTREFEWGFFSNLKFSNGYSFNRMVNREYSIQDESLVAIKDMASDESAYNTNTGFTLSTGFKYKDNHKVKLHHVYTHDSKNSVRLTEGYADNIDHGLFLKEYYVEKMLNNTSLSGHHTLNSPFEQRIDWSVTAGISQLLEPDVKNLNYRLRDEGNQSYYQMDTYSWSAGTREFTTGDDMNGNIDLNYQAVFTDRYNAEYKFKTGLRVQGKTRQFEKRSFYHKHTSGGFPSDVSEIEDPAAVGSGLTDDAYYSLDESGNPQDGLIVVESTQGSDGYGADEVLNAEYFMIDIPLGLSVMPALNRVRFIGGVRREDYRLNLLPYNPVSGQPYSSSLTGGDPLESIIDEVEYLPSLNLATQTSENTKLRLAYSQTIGRPEFREIAPFEFQSFYGDAVVVGYPFLKTTDIQNYDIRFEWFPQVSEIIALSLFTKQFTNPIETSLVQTADRTYRTLQNAKSATNSGVEFEVRENLDFIPIKYGQTSVQFNATYIQSSVTTNSVVKMFNGVEAANSATTTKRPLEGQSDILVNASIHYSDLQGFNASLAYNAYSKRLRALGTYGLPNIYEYPFHSVNLTSSKQLGSFEVSMKIKNLLGAERKFGQIDPKTDEMKITKGYSPGRAISLGIAYKL